MKLSGLAVVVLVMLFASVGFVNAQSIQEQLRNAREKQKWIEETAKSLGLCISEPDCTDDNDAWKLTEKYGYVESTLSTDDIIEFLKDYSTGKLVNKTELKTQGNFCFTPTNCKNITEEAKEARASFDKYW